MEQNNLTSNDFYRTAYTGFILVFHDPCICLSKYANYQSCSIVEVIVILIFIKHATLSLFHFLTKRDICIVGGESFSNDYTFGFKCWLPYFIYHFKHLHQVLPYDQLMLELDVTNVRELEDFLINECMYAGIVRGKLDQLRRCFEIHFAAGRDLRSGQLGSMIQTLSGWLETSDNLLISIQEKIKWADAMSEENKKHRKEVEDRVEEVKKSIAAKKLHTVSRPKLTSEGLRNCTLNLVD
ncbi:uncharacterized protein LOC120132946 [Hibiscus syriacus]|uniref:uncharacterized protein LOC120132946 n=1 Tax=Hibiscus syriacus TaxID=106335 RepID=UPI001924C9E5|nr:uncharacterized protein LOC120132946 [Hibiscus syriacus]